MDVLPALSSTVAPTTEVSMAGAAIHAGFRRNAVTRVCALGVATLGALVLAGWLSGATWLTMLGSGFSMAPNTGLAFVLLGTALYAQASDHSPGIFRAIATSGALGVALIGGLTVAQYWFGVDFRIDSLLATDTQSIVRTRFPQRMAEVTSALLLLLGCSLLALQTRSRAGIVLAQIAAFVAFLGSMTALVGYTYSTDDFQSLPYFAGIAPHTVAGLIAASAGLLSVRNATSGLENWPGFRKIGIQLLLLVLVAALPLAGVIAISVYYEAAREQSLAITTMRIVTRDVAYQSTAFLNRAREQLNHLAQRPLVKALDSSRCDPLIAEMPRMNAEIAAVTLVDARGNVLCWSLAQSTSGVSYSDRDWYRSGITAGGFRAGQPVFGRATRELIVPLTMPIIGENKMSAGVLNFATSMREISRMVENRKLPAGWVVSVISRDGVVIARSLDAGQWLGKAMPQDPGIKKRLEQGEGVATLIGLDGIERIYAFTTLKDTGWLISTAVPVEFLQQPYRQRLHRIAAISALIIALISWLAFFIARAISRPIRSLDEAARAAARGEFGVPAIEGGPIEVRSVTRGFNRMLAARQQYESDLVQQQALEKQQAIRLEAANKELEAFAYSVSHDLRVPLRAIDGFSHMVEKRYRDKLDDEGRRLIQVVRDNARKMGQLIDDILAFSRMGRKEMTQVEVDMANLARAATEELAPDSAARKFELRIGELPPARGDAAMLRQVWVNLIGNAIKFSRTNTAARIEIGARIAADEQIYYVQDNGVGFDMEYAAKLFGVFQRLHGVDEFEGTGIGLAIVKRIVTRHGGRVWAEGKVNEGATIYFALPKLGEPSIQDDAPAQHETGVIL